MDLLGCLSFSLTKAVTGKNIRVIARHDDIESKCRFSISTCLAYSYFLILTFLYELKRIREYSPSY